MAIEINLNNVASATDLSSHELDVNNPHAVTKTQVGLSDVDNTSDVNKLISSATQTALNGKEDLSNKQTDLTPSATKYPTVNAVNTGLSGKLNDIPIDSTPTSSSTNLVTSGGVFTGLGTKQEALVSGTNIKSVNGNSLLGSGDLVISGGGGTPAGLTGQIQFNNGGAFGADSGLFWDNTLKRLILKAVGSTGTDIPFRVRNSADTADLFIINGNKAFNLGGGIIGDGFTTYLSSQTGVTQITASGNGLVMTSNYLTQINAANQVAIQTNSVTRIHLDNVGNVGIGSSTTLGARLDVRAQGALSTDIAFRVRNSADNKNIVEVRGDGETRWNGLPAVGNYVAIKNYTSYDATIDLMGGSGIKAQISMDLSSNLTINRGLNIWNPGIVGQPTAKINNIVKSGLGAYGAGYGFNWAFTSNVDGIFTQAERALWLTSTKSLLLFNGSSIPDTHSEKADSFEMYSDDITAGNAAPHFRTEIGSVIKLYQETTAIAASTLISNLGTPLTDTDTFDGYTLQQVVKALKNLGILA